MSAYKYYFIAGLMAFATVAKAQQTNAVSQTSKEQHTPAGAQTSGIQQMPVGPQLSSNRQASVEANASAIIMQQSVTATTNKPFKFTASQVPITGGSSENILSWTPLPANLQTSPIAKTQFLSTKQPAASKPVPSGYLNASSPTPDSYYQQCFGYFCKREWELQQKVHVPIKLRLGTYQTAQIQEGK